MLGHRLTSRERLSVKAIRDALVHDMGLLRGATIPLLALVLAWVVGASKETGVTAALWCAVAGVIAFELAAAARSRATPRELTLEVGVGIALGVGIIGLKVLLHR